MVLDFRRNNLDEETSPYLHQHRDNPVHWQPWRQEVLRHAREHDRPILLSVGYAACHWCHVMAHESFENEEIAGVMNDLFVNIKVDREERPDIDAIYQSALQLLGQQGGWPLTMFLTPDGEPFWGGTYFPSAPKFGRPGFTEVLNVVETTYRNQPERVEHNRAALAEALANLSAAQGGGDVPHDIADTTARRLLDIVDMRFGGLGEAPKFPHVADLDLLLRAWRREGEGAFMQAVEVSADAMARGGIYDHLRGGWARYSVDRYWLAPHFEKMLYDNALLVDFYTRLWLVTGKDLYRRRVEETVAWLQSEMLTGEGAFCSSLDADSLNAEGHGEEGAFYVWTEAEIDTVLGEDSPFFKEFHDVKPHGNWEGKTILNSLVREPDAAGESPPRATAPASPRTSRGAPPAGPRRQGAGGLERSHDPGPGARRRCLRANGVDRHGAARLRSCLQLHGLRGPPGTQREGRRHPRCRDDRRLQPHGRRGAHPSMT